MNIDESEAGADSRTRELGERLRAIEELPLASRAEALGVVHEQLRVALEAGDAAADRA